MQQRFLRLAEPQHHTAHRVQRITQVEPCMTVLWVRSGRYLKAAQGQRAIKPMRYQCRPAGKPAFYDTKFPGTYNARRDKLTGSFWRPLFGHTHGLLVINAFFENVSRQGPDGGTENVVLEFRPQPPQDILVACLWSRWTGANGEELLSFAAVTDEPPAEIAAAGHDRCIVPIKEEHVDAWLDPVEKDLSASYAILDDRQRPHYGYRLAA
jgi:putative SOS response-associated peptidase YedK